MASNTVSLARILLLVLFPIYLCARVATLVQEFLFAVPVPPSYGTHRSTPQTRWFPRSTFSTSGPPLRTV